MTNLPLYDHRSARSKKVRSILYKNFTKLVNTVTLKLCLILLLHIQPTKNSEAGQNSIHFIIYHREIDFTFMSEFSSAMLENLVLSKQKSIIAIFREISEKLGNKPLRNMCLQF